MMRFAYADPPYLGQGKKHYSAHHDSASDADSLWWHKALIDRLCDEYPDGWALSASSPSLSSLLPICPDDVRVAAWVKPFAVFKPNVNPAYAWEPVLFRGGRKRTRKDPTARDWHSENITLRKGLPGAKPPGFSLWILSLLGVRADLGDTIDDLFPGTGAVLSAWQAATCFDDCPPGHCACHDGGYARTVMRNGGRRYGKTAARGVPEANCGNPDYDTHTADAARGEG